MDYFTPCNFNWILARTMAADSIIHHTLRPLYQFWRGPPRFKAHVGCACLTVKRQNHQKPRATTSTRSSSCIICFWYCSSLRKDSLKLLLSRRRGILTWTLLVVYQVLSLTVRNLHRHGESGGIFRLRRYELNLTLIVKWVTKISSLFWIPTFDGRNPKQPLGIYRTL